MKFVFEGSLAEFTAVVSSSPASDYSDAQIIQSLKSELDDVRADNQTLLDKLTEQREDFLTLSRQYQFTQQKNEELYAVEAHLRAQIAATGLRDCVIPRSLITIMQEQPKLAAAIIREIFIRYEPTPIDLIKKIREATGWGLKESKDWYEANLR